MPRRRSTLTAFAVAIAVIGAPGGAAVGQSDPALVREIEAVLHRAEAIHDQNDSARLFDELWLQGPNIVFMSEQFYPVFYGREPVEAYFKPPGGRNMYAWRTRLSNVEAMYLAPDLAFATYEGRYDMHAYTRTPLGGWTRKVAIFQRTAEGWKYVADFETPMSLISQARRMHEEALSADFLAFSRRQNPQYDEQVARDRKIRQRRGEGVPWVSAGENIQQGGRRSAAPEGADERPWDAGDRDEENRR